MPLHYQSVGQGQPLLLLHGLFGSGDNWGIIAKHFSSDFQVISVDLRNHGRSPHHASQTYDEMADDLIALLDALDVDSIHLLGHSLGGKVAMQFATRYPKRLNKLIIVDMAMRAYQDTHTHLIDAMLGVDFEQCKNRTAVDKALSHAINTPMVRQFLLLNLVKSDNANQALAWRINLPALKANYPALQQAIIPAIPYHQPCLFICGEHSDYVNDTDISQIKHHFTQAQFVHLPTDHWVHAEQPQAFIDVVSQFLST